MIGDGVDDAPARTFRGFVDYREISSREPAFPESVMDYLRSLSIIQGATTTPVRVPDLTEVTSADAREVVEAAAILTGHTVVSKWDTIPFKSEAAPEIGPSLEAAQIDLESHYQIKITEPLIVTVGDQELTLGAVERLLLSAAYKLEDDELVGRPLMNDTAYRTFAPGVPVPDRNNRSVQGKLLGSRSDAVAEGTPVGQDDAR